MTTNVLLTCRQHHNLGRTPGLILGVTDEPLVSSDFNHSPYSSIFDSALTRVIDKTFVKVLSWYDNEWGFSNRMRDVTVHIGSKL